MFFERLPFLGTTNQNWLFTSCVDLDVLIIAKKATILVLMKQAKTIRQLYEQGLEIVETNNLYGVWRKIPNAKDKSFDEMSRQNIYPATYKKWWIDAEKCFSKNLLNFLRFKKKVFAVDSQSDYGVGHAGYLLMALDELEKIIDDSKYQQSYMLSAKKVQQWPEVEYENGIVRQGNKLHQFSNIAAKSMLGTLWPKRQIVQPDSIILRVGKVTDWGTFAKSIGSNKGTVQAINKSMREKAITLRVIYPKRINGLLLVVTQKERTKFSSF